MKGGSDYLRPFLWLTPNKAKSFVLVNGKSSKSSEEFNK